MSFANKYLASLRKIGRKVVLPSEQIKQILRSEIDFYKIRNIVDFGAGTLYWSEYFANIAESGNSSLTQSSRELEKSSLDGLQFYHCADFPAQPTNLAQDTRIARANNAKNAESTLDSAKNITGGGEYEMIWVKRALFLLSTKFIAK